MPRIIDYHDALERLRVQRIISLYHNSGALGFEKGIATRSIGWIGPEDPTIRAEARSLTRNVPPPHEANLARLLVRAWREVVGHESPAWLMPASHWAYELEFGSSAWMPGMLRSMGVDPEVLRPRNDAAAIEFTLREVDAFERAARTLLENLLGSDFTIAFPARPVVCRLHHHKQLWWTSSDAQMIESIDALSPAG